MLSAVESNSSHLGSSRAYNVHHHLAYGGGVSNGPSPSITAGTGLNTYPTNSVPVMSSTEFVKPHPKLSRYSSLSSSRNSNSGGGGSNGSPGSNGLLPSPVTSGNSKFKYASSVEQPVNLAMGVGSPVATSSPVSSPQQQQQQQQSMTVGMDKLKNEFDLMKAAGHLPPGSFADFLYSRHAAAAAAGFLSPQSYPSLMYPSAGPTGPPPSSLYSDPSRRSLSPGKNSAAALGRSNSDSLAAYHHLQRSPGTGAPNGMPFGHPGQAPPPPQQQHSPHAQQKGLKGSSAANGFLLPPPPAMLPTQAELEAYHAYQGVVEMNNRLYYNGHGPSPEQLMNAQQQQQHRMHSSQQVSQQQQQQQNLPPPPVMSRGPQTGGKRAIHGAADVAGMYHQQQQQQQQHHPSPHRSQLNGELRGGGATGKGVANNQQEKNIGFKVPGKEGSLKHRLLTTRTKERKSKGQQNGMKNINNSSSYGTSNIIKSNFNKGVLIELGNGELKPVEEMRTEDFILSSTIAPDLEMIDSTILRIMPHGNVIVLTLSNSASKSNIDLTVAPEHPFFVYRQGWASCNPEGTYQMHGLKCQRLEVGDVCISLMQKERNGANDSAMLEENARVNSASNSSSSSSSTSSASSSLSSPPPTTGNNPHPQHHHQQQQQQQQQEEPQNLSRKQSPRGLIEGTTYHPSLKAPAPSSSPSSAHSIAKSSSSGSLTSCSSGSGRDLSRDTSAMLYPGADHPQPLHALVHAHLNHAAHSRPELQSHQHQQLQAQQQSPVAGVPGGNNNHQLMDSIFSTLKHNYLAAFEQAASAAVAMNGKMNIGGGGGGNGNNNSSSGSNGSAGGLSHSIKNLVMRGMEETSNGGVGSNSSPASYPPYSPESNSSSKRRFSAPDNVYGEELSMGNELEYEPPKKIASH